MDHARFLMPFEAVRDQVEQLVVDALLALAVHVETIVSGAQQVISTAEEKEALFVDIQHQNGMIYIPCRY